MAKDPANLIERLDLPEQEKLVVEYVWQLIDTSQKKAKRKHKTALWINLLTVSLSLIVFISLNVFFVYSKTDNSQILFLALAFTSLLVPILLVFDKVFHFEDRGKEYAQLNEALTEEFWEFILMDGRYKKYSNYREAFSTFLNKSENIAIKPTKSIVNLTRLEPTADSEREVALQAYLDRMAEFLVAQDLRTSASEDEIRKVARVRTLTTLRELDGFRKGMVIKFLYEADLIAKNKPIIDLADTDLSGAELNRSNLRNVNLSGADMSKANLSEANLEDACLRGTNLSRANLSSASLKDADLSGASLMEASLRGADLSEANLDGANLSGADLSRAVLKGTKITSVQLGSTASKKL
jgi:hypothetical protein